MARGFVACALLRALWVTLAIMVIALIATNTWRSSNCQ